MMVSESTQRLSKAVETLQNAIEECEVDFKDSEELSTAREILSSQSHGDCC